jgi:polar amino acid transport system permease protein
VEGGDAVIQLLLKGALVTLEISLLAVAMGFLLGVVCAALSSEAMGFKWSRYLVRGYVTVVRGTPLFVQLLIVYFAIPEVVGINMPPVWAGILTLGLNSTAYLCETIRAGLDGLPRGQREAAAALGYTKLQAMRGILLPQALRQVLPAITNEIVTLIKESSILMVIGVPEMTKVAKEIVARQLNPMEVYLATAALYLVITGALGSFLKRLERVCHVAH